jgi:hypothetical protein
MIDLSRAILYLRLPSRAETRSKEDKSHSFPFAVANHGRLQRASHVYSIWVSNLFYCHLRCWVWWRSG